MGRRGQQLGLALRSKSAKVARARYDGTVQPHFLLLCDGFSYK